LDSFPEWSGIGKTVHPSPLREQIIASLDTSFYRVNNKAQELEHSIEGLIPFLQYSNPEIRITPIMVTAMQFERMSMIASKLGSVISAYIKSRNLVLGRDIFFLISADANHYGQDFQNAPFGEDSAAHTMGINQDRRIAQSYIEGPITDAKVQEFIGEMKNVVWCGKFSIPFGLLTAEKVVEQTTGKHLHGHILRYSDTYTEGVLSVEGTSMGTTAPHSLKHWVGFLSAGFTLE
jgi:AmmeMemoRadiSam system protein B